MILGIPIDMLLVIIGFAMLVGGMISSIEAAIHDGAYQYLSVFVSWLVMMAGVTVIWVGAT